MKVFVAEKRKKGNFGKDGYHWCDNSDLLMFGQFQLGNNNPSEISMFGINSGKATTYILVEDIKISKEFYRELLVNCVENGMECKVDEEGNFGVNLECKVDEESNIDDLCWSFNFNIDEIINELLDKANKFDDKTKVKCFGRTITAK